MQDLDILIGQCDRITRMLANTGTHNAADARDLQKARNCLREVRRIIAAWRGDPNAEFLACAYGLRWDLVAVDARIHMAKNLILKVRERSPDIFRRGDGGKQEPEQICMGAD